MRWRFDLLLLGSALMLCSCQGELQPSDAPRRDAATPGADDAGSGDASTLADATLARDAGGSVPSDAGDRDAGAAPIVLRERRAFPTAEGYGAVATGGRGGRVLYVTTLEDTGDPGSLRWALRQDFPRIVYFLVGGEFVLDRLLYVANGDLTIAGETANDLGGVHIRGVDRVGDHRLYFSNVHNMIIRYISVHFGWQNWEDDGTRHNPMTFEGVHRVIVDHYTGGWGSYTGGVPAKLNEHTGRGGQATAQWSLFHECVSGHNVGGVGGLQMDYIRNGFPEEEHAERWASWDGFSNHHNAFIGLTHRFFNTGGNGTIADEVTNNIVYGWNGRMSRHSNGNQPIDIHHNIYQAAPYNRSVAYEYMHQFDHNDYYNLNPPIEVTPNFHLEGNRIYERDGTVFQGDGDDNWPMLRHFRDSRYGDARTPVTDADRRDRPAASPEVPITQTPMDNLWEEVLQHSGAGVRFDEDGEVSNANTIDQRYLRWARERGGPSFTSASPGDGGLGDSATFVFPSYESRTRDESDLDANGVPHGWEPPEEVLNEAGYSRLELYLAELAGDFYMLRRR